MKKIDLLYCIFVLALVSCQKEELLPVEPQNSFLKTVSEKEALDLLNNFSDTRKSSKSADYSYAEPHLDSLTYEELLNTEEKILVIPATIQNNSGKSRILFMKLEGVVEGRILTLNKEDTISTEYFSGMMSLRSLQGEFLIGYRVRDGVLVSKFLPKSTKSTSKTSSPCDSYKTGEDWNCGELDEVYLEGTTAEPTPYVSITHIYVLDSGSGGEEPYYYKTFDSGGAGGGADGDTTTPTEEEEDKIVNELKNPCAYGIFFQLENGIYTSDLLKPELEVPLNPFYTDTQNLTSISLTLSDKILALFNNSNQFHYSIKNGQTKGNASTIGSTTTINDTYLSTATRLSIARTMIHELVHAYLNVKYSNPIALNSMDFRTLMDKYAAETGYPIGSNEYHHNFMGRYISAMAYSLREWDKVYGTGGGLGWDYYFSMSFAGQFTVDQNGNILTETDTFKAMVPNSSDRKAIAKIVVDEINGNADSKGGKCLERK